MKKLMIASVAFFGVLCANAQTSPNPAAVSNTAEKTVAANPADAEDTEKVPVKPEALPQGIKTTLAGADYQGWTVSNAYLVKGETKHYEITLAKGEEKKTIHLDEAGKEVK